MDNAELGVLLIHLVRIPALRSKAVDQLKPAVNKEPADELFSDIITPVHYTMWHILADIHSQNASAYVPRLAMQTELNKRLSALEDFRDYASESEALMDFVYETPSEHINMDIGDQYLQRAIVDIARKKFMAKADLIYDSASVAKFLNDAQGIYTAPSNTDTLKTPFMEVDKYLNQSPLILSGMPVLDTISGGGAPRKTVIGLLGPTGGGKTMSTYQITVGQAKRKQHCLVMTYEQQIEGDIMHRMCSGVLGVDIEHVSKPFADWSKENQERYLKLRPLFGPYMHIKDMTQPNQGCRGIFDIIDSVDALEAAGCMPIYILVDWLKPLIIRYLVSHGLPVTDDQFRTHASLFLDQAGQFVKDRDVIMIVNHQLDTKTSRASPNRKPVVTDAAEFKSFSYNLDACYILGNRDKETNIAWFLSDKNRRGVLSEMLVKMKGNLARFDPAGDYTTDHMGRFIKGDEVMPDEIDEPQDRGLSDNYV